MNLKKIVTVARNPATVATTRLVNFFLRQSVPPMMVHAAQTTAKLNQKELSVEKHRLSVTCLSIVMVKVFIVLGTGYTCIW